MTPRYAAVVVDATTVSSTAAASGVGGTYKEEEGGWNRAKKKRKRKKKGEKAHEPWRKSKSWLRFMIGYTRQKKETEKDKEEGKKINGILTPFLLFQEGKGTKKNVE